MISLDVVTVHVTGYVVNRICRQFKILALRWPHTGSNSYGYRYYVRQAALIVENNMKRLRQVFSLRSECIPDHCMLIIICRLNSVYKLPISSCQAHVVHFDRCYIFTVSVKGVQAQGWVGGRILCGIHS